MFARFDENPAMTLRVIKETKRYGRTHGRTDNVKTVYPLQTKFAGGIMTTYITLSIYMFFLYWPFILVGPVCHLYHAGRCSYLNVILP